jgi:hypothetical protein
MTALVVSGLLGAGVTASLAAGAAEDPALEELWEQFPLDDERNAPSARDQSSDLGRARVEPARVRPAASIQTGESDEAVGTPGWLAVLIAGIALLIAGIGAAFARARHARHRPGAKQPARSRRLWAVKATDPPPGARDGAEHLVQFLKGEAVARARKEVQMLRSTERPGQASSSEILKAKLSEVNAPKEAKTGAQFETEVLKRKPAADTQMLEAKRQGDAVASKVKLASTHEQKQEVMPREQRVRARAPTAQAKRKQALLPAPAREDGEPKADAWSARAKAGRLLACEVRWWPRDMTSRFLAAELAAEGAESTIATSLPFDWRESEPPPESPEAAEALAGLLDLLLREGWVVAGRGEEWFAVRLLLPGSVSRDKASRGAAHSSR